MLPTEASEKTCNLNILELFSPVRTFIFETDHVLTDGRIGLGADNQAPVRHFSARDLYAIRKAIDGGYQVSIVRPPELPGTLPTGITVTDNRDQIPLVAGGATILYMNGLYTVSPAARQGIFYCCPADAVPEVKALATYISPYKGGEGCVYDVIEKVLKLNNHW